MIRPVMAPISQQWGANPHYYWEAFGIPYHNGVDYAAPEGTDILCVDDGIVAWSGDDEHYGLYVRVYHSRWKICSFYAHLAELHHEQGEPLAKAALIGPMGNTGNSTGPHLHFEIRLMLGPEQYATSPYSGIGRGRINPETWYATHERLTMAI